MTGLFAEPTRLRTRPLGNTEPPVNWYLESTRPEACAARAAVNAWYEAFPDTNGGFADRLRSKVDVDHRQSLDELYVHHLLTSVSGDVRYEEGGVGPDFRIYREGVAVGAVEVATLFTRQDWQDEERAHGILADEVNRRLDASAGWFVDFEVVQAARQVSPRRFVAFLRSELNQLPPPGPEAQALVAAGLGLARLPSATYRAEGVEILARFMPMKSGAGSIGDPDTRIVGMGPIIGGAVNSATRLRARIGQKAGGRYNIDGLPFLVAVGLYDSFCSDDQVVQALYGSKSLRLSTGRLIRVADGLFGDGNRHTRLSAVATLTNLQPWQPTPSELTIWDPPQPQCPWPDELLPHGRRLQAPA